MEKAKLVRRHITEKGQLVMPGVFDALSAKIASRAGFEVIFITGYSLSATLLGEPDFGLLTQTEVVNAAQRICSVVDTPVIVDADTGYGIHIGWNSSRRPRFALPIKKRGKVYIGFEDLP